MSIEQNRTIAIRIADELFNKGNMSIADELIAPGAVDHNEPDGTDCRQHFKEVATMLRGAFPDLRFVFEDVIVEGERVAARVTMSGTHQGPGAIFGVAPSGKHFEIQQLRLLRIVNGQMQDSWSVIDVLSWMQQLGALPQRPAFSGGAPSR